MKTRSGLTAGALALFFVLLTVGTVGGIVFKTWLPPVASEHGKTVDAVIRYLLVSTGFIFGAGTAQRLSRKAELGWALSVAFGMSLVAEVGVLAIGMPAWAAVYGQAEGDELQVEVVGYQFGWIVRYPGKDGKFGKVDPNRIRRAINPLGLVEEDPAAADDKFIGDELHLPVGRPVRVILRSLDVLHSFSVPEMRVKQDIIPGYTGSTRFQPSRLGTYEIACAELCGLGHYMMRGQLVISSPEDYQAWLASLPAFLEE